MWLQGNECFKFDKYHLAALNFLVRFSLSFRASDEEKANNIIGEDGIVAALKLLFTSRSLQRSCFAHTLQLVVKDGFEAMGTVKTVSSLLKNI